VLRSYAALSVLLFALSSACVVVNDPPAMQPRPVQQIPDNDDDNQIDDDIEEPAIAQRFTMQLTNIAPWTVLKSGAFDVPVGRASPGPIRSGDAYEITFTAGRAHRVSFATMFGASNDWFYGTPSEGVALYEDGVPLAQDITSLLRLYDAGTEIDEEPSVGASTGPRQSSPDAGAPDAIGFVRALGNPIVLTDGSSFTMPALEDVLHASIVPVGDRTFRLRIENVSAPGALPTSQGARDIALSPGVWVVHGNMNPLFTVGEADRGEGLELIAEAGRMQTLASFLAERSGVATGFSPGTLVVHSSGKPLFSVGQPDRGLGLEQIAESGNVSVLDEALGTAFPEGASVKAIFNMVDGSDAPGPLRVGDTYTFTFEAMRGDRLSFASMFGASNDWIVGGPDDGIALFDDDGAPLSGDHTSALRFYDVGTEIDEEPAVGAHTGPNQMSPDDGPADPIAIVRELSPTVYPFPVDAHLSLTITAQTL
jgi:hypothetical protein